MCRYTEHGLTENQQTFADEYLKDRNATRAYRTAYASVKSYDTASSNGSRLLKNAKVREYIDRREAEMQDDRIADSTEIRAFLTSVVRGETPDTTPLFVGGGVQELAEQPPSVSNRIRAAELMGKLMGLFQDQVRVSVAQMPKITSAGDGSVEIDVPD